MTTQPPTPISRDAANTMIAELLEPQRFKFQYLENIRHAWQLLQVIVDGLPFYNHPDIYRILGHPGASNIIYQVGEVAAEEIALAFLHAVTGVRYVIDPPRISTISSRGFITTPQLVLRS